MERKSCVLYISCRPKIINQGAYKKDSVFIMFLSQCGGVQICGALGQGRFLANRKQSKNETWDSECTSLRIYRRPKYYSLITGNNFDNWEFFFIIINVDNEITAIKLSCSLITGINWVSFTNNLYAQKKVLHNSEQMHMHICNLF